MTEMPLPNSSPPELSEGPVASRGSLPIALWTASVMVVFFGLKEASTVALPAVFSIFLGILAWPMLRGLTRLRVPRVAAVPLVVLAVTAALIGIVALLGSLLADFTSALPQYQARLASTMSGVQTQLVNLGMPEDFKLLSLADPAEVLNIAGRGLRGVVGALSNTLLVMLLLLFVLVEGFGLPQKLRCAITDDEVIDRVEGFSASIQRYLLIKTGTSALTGVSIATGLAAIGLDFPLLWGLGALFLNFIPSVGSIIAALPAIVLALVQFGWGGALGVMLLFLVVNVAIGNLLEPRIMGDELGLSPLVVLLSLLLWGWTWGPLGMLLAVPMTVIVKLMLELRDDTRWIAVMMGSAPKGEEA